MRRLLIIALLLVAPVLPATALGQTGQNGQRIALVIGNTDYRSLEPVRTASIDARTLASALERQGFAVQTGIDLEADAMRQAVQAFDRRAAEADVAAVFYFGHGVQADGQNYLLPVTVQPGPAPDWEANAVPLRSLVAAVGRARTLGLVLLDASRRNAFSEQGTVPAGLAQPPAPPGKVVVAFSAQPGEVAGDLFRFHSAYGSALMEHLDDTGTRLADFLSRVRQAVINDSRGQQQPAAWGAVETADFTFAPPPPPPAPPSPAETAAVAAAEQAAVRERERAAAREQAEAAAREEAAVWGLISGSSDPAVFDAYLARFPNGRFAAEAAARKAALEAAPPAATAAAPPPTAPTVRPAPPAAAPPGSALPPGGTQQGALPALPSADADPPLTEEERRRVQLSLQRIGFYTYHIDAIFGPITRQAINKFQVLIGAEPTGFLSEPQIAMLHRVASTSPFAGRAPQQATD